MDDAPAMPTPEVVSEITLHLLHALETGVDLRVRWRYSTPHAEIGGFALLPAEYYAFSNDLSRWATITGPVNGQTLTYTVQQWTLVEEHEIADTAEYNEMQFLLTEEGHAWVATHPEPGAPTS
jgi:hypothetical protein